MYRGMKLVEEKISAVDVFIEVRDARVPISSFNKSIDDIIKTHQKEKIILLNKFDLCNKEKTNKVIQELKSLGYIALPISSKSRGFDFTSILKLSRTVKVEKYGSVGLWMMIGGMPNVGKSNIINSLRVVSKSFKNNEVTRTTNRPCQTTYVNGFKICSSPLAYMVDSPGILLPNITSAEMGLNLGLIGSIRDSIVGKRALIEYLFDILGPHGVDIMFRKYNMTVRPKNVDDLLDRVIEAFKCESEDIACDRILKDFRTGEFGKFTLDTVHKLID